jgi:preprotein translocase subunit SecA
LICAVADLPAPELLKEVRQAYAEGLIDDTVADLEGIESDLTQPNPGRLERRHLITDAIAEMEWWSSFHPEDHWPKSLPEPETPVLPPAIPAPSTLGYVAPEPFVREPKIGRNDPCPCGSGKKYKKCCGKG